MRTATTSRLLLLLLAAAFVVACASPGSETTIPGWVAYGLSGGDASKLPPEAFQPGHDVSIDLHWYDRAWGFQADIERADGSQHFADLTSTSDASNALEARRSDNERAIAQTELVTDLLMRGLAAFAASQGLPLAAPQPNTEHGAPPPSSNPREAPAPEFMADSAPEPVPLPDPAAPAADGTP